MRKITLVIGVVIVLGGAFFIFNNRTQPYTPHALDPFGIDRVALTGTYECLPPKTPVADLGCKFVFKTDEGEYYFASYQPPTNPFEDVQEGRRYRTTGLIELPTPYPGDHHELYPQITYRLNVIEVGEIF